MTTFTDVSQIIIVGNPNVGKSVIFGCLTRKYVTVSNYPGTTVTVTSGWMETAGGPLQILDTPGVNNLLPASEEEAVTRDILLEHGEAARIIQVVDAKNLKRGLFLSLQLAEMGVQAALGLNLWDEAQGRGLEVDWKALESILGVPCVPTIAIHHKGVQELASAPEGRFQISVQYPAAIEEALVAMSEFLPPKAHARRAMGLMALAGDETFYEYLGGRIPAALIERLRAIREKTRGLLNADPRHIIDRTRMNEAERIAARVTRKSGRVQARPKRDAMERLSLSFFGGGVLLIFVLYFLYLFVGVLGAGILVDLVEGGLFQHFVHPAAIRVTDFLFPFPHTHMVEEGLLVTGYVSPDVPLTAVESVCRFLHDFLVGDYGAVTMALTYGIAIIFPVILTFFLAFALLEDVGYLPRLSVLLNRLFGIMGLNGKAVLPMVLGLGCVTMATMTTRILDTRKERIIMTFLLALAVPCSAQLAIILFLLQRGAGPRGVLVWGFIVGTVLLVSGFLASRLVRGEDSPLILEIPPFRLPSLSNIALKTLARIEWYLREVIPVFLLGTLMLFLLHEADLLAVIEHHLEPLVVRWLGLPGGASEAILMGFFRRDYGAAGFIAMFERGELTSKQILVGVTTITLFVPCIANALVIVKERGLKTALILFFLVMTIAFLVGGLVNRLPGL